jgi:hypothetical protein
MEILFSKRLQWLMLLNKPAWGSLDILEACGASDSGSNPDAGVLFINVIIKTGKIRLICCKDVSNPFPALFYN